LYPFELFFAFDLVLLHLFFEIAQILVNLIAAFLFFTSGCDGDVLLFLLSGGGLALSLFEFGFSL
jgi:hypothetical protein